MNKLLFYIFFNCLFFNCANAQNNVFAKTQRKKISSLDSTKFETYLMKADAEMLFSYHRQLYLDSVLSIAPWVADLWQLKAMPLFKQKKYEIGMVYLDSAVKYDTANYYIQYRGFIKCIFQKSYAAAIIDLEEAKKRNGFVYEMDHSLDFYIGLSYLQLNQFSLAEKHLKVSIDYDEKKYGKGNCVEYFYLGIINKEEDKIEDAIKEFDKALKIYTNFSDAKFYKASCLNILNNHIDANKLLTEAKENFEKGYTINEGNTPYEQYPYQIKLTYFK